MSFFGTVLKLQCFNLFSFLSFYFNTCNFYVWEFSFKHINHCTAVGTKYPFRNELNLSNNTGITSKPFPQILYYFLLCVVGEFWYRPYIIIIFWLWRFKISFIVIIIVVKFPTYTF